MLRTYLKATPHPKFILLQDTAKYKGADSKDMLEYLMNNGLKFIKDVKYRYYQFQYNKYIDKFDKNIIIKDCIGKFDDWNAQDKSDLFDFCGPTVLIIDSLAHMIFHFGTTKTYQMLHALKDDQNVTQIIAVLHTDIIEDSNDKNIFEHLSTLSMTLEGNFRSQKRVSFVYKKSGGKIIHDIEEYSFENGNFVTKSVPKLDAKALIAEGASTIDPQTLTTFKIGLGDKDKESRHKLVLPYLPKLNFTAPGEESQIFYDFDEIDDWDEEDPDDDLDI